MATRKRLAPVGFFKYDWMAPPSFGDFRRVAIMFRVPEYAGATELADLFETIALGPLVPDLVVLLEISLYRDDPTLSGLFTDDLVADARTRVAGRIPVVIAKLSLATSEFDLELTDRAFDVGWEELERALREKQDDWFGAGLQHVFSRERVVIPAPAGYRFLKPSKSRSSYFVRAEQGLLTSGEVFYVAACIWRKLIEHDTFDPHRITRVFVDTIGIAPVAFALRELFRGSGHQRAPLVESFHSYDGMENIRSPLPGSSICLISASTSMGLHRDWMTAHKVSETEVLTLITIEGAQDEHRALWALPADIARTEGVTTAKFDIRIEGETFVPSPEPPKQVFLGRIHKRDDLVSGFHDLRLSSVFDVYRLDDRPTPRQRALFVDGTVLVATPQFKAWLRKTLNQHAKSVTRVIVHLDDSASMAMAKQAKRHLDKLLASPVRLLKASAVGTGQFDSADADAGILVVGAVIARGGSLLNLSRNLRGLQFGPRLYLVGYQVVENAAQLDAMVANLRQTKHRASVDVHRFGSAAIGSGIADSYSSEHDFLNRIGSGDVPAPAFVQNRLKYLAGATAGQSRGALWPRGTRARNPLELRKDFLLWPEQYAPGPHQPEVIATMAVTVENVRVPGNFSDEHSLHSPVLRQVALSPQNFMRFDDGIIQAALLRCAERSELDYRDSAESSRYMRQFVMRLLENLHTDRAEAILEFLLALRTGRMMLQVEDEQEIFNVAGKVEGDSALHKLVRFLATAEERSQSLPL